MMLQQRAQEEIQKNRERKNILGKQEKYGTWKTKKHLEALFFETLFLLHFFKTMNICMISSVALPSVVLLSEQELPSQLS